MNNIAPEQVQKMLDEKKIVPQFVANQNDCKVYFVDFTRNRIICTAESSRMVSCNPFHFNRLFTRPEYRHAGLATLAIKLLFEQLSHYDFPVLNLDINPYYNKKDYPELEMFYTKLGFVRVIIQDGKKAYKTFYHADESLGEEVDLDIFKANKHELVFPEKMHFVTESCMLDSDKCMYSASASWYADKIAFWTDTGTAVSIIQAPSDNETDIVKCMREYIENHQALFQ